MHVVLAQAVVELGELLLGEATEHEVLAVRDADVDVEVALDLGEAAELVRGDVAEVAVRVGTDRAVRPAAHDVGHVPAAVVVEAAQLDRNAAVGRDRGADAGRRVAALLDDGREAGARVRRRRAQELALLDDPLAQLLDAHRVDQPLHAGPQLVVTVAVVVERAQARLDGGEQVLAAW